VSIESPTITDAVIRVERVTRAFTLGDVTVQALRGVNLSVGSGEFIAIIGSSGSGKSTLMNILGCLDRPTSGRYLFEGVDVAGLREPDLARIRSERLGFVLLALSLALAGSEPPVAAAETIGNPAEGHRLALKICAACHVVGPDQQYPPLLRRPAPNFQAIAAKPGSAASLQQFILTTHSAITTPENMPNPQLTEDQAADIATYIASLRPAKPESPK
jgi:energy-coupling factor transporter ATP-binding protein EcfA2